MVTDKGGYTSGGVFANFEKPVTSAAVLWNGSGYSLAVADADLKA